MAPHDHATLSARATASPGPARRRSAAMVVACALVLAAAAHGGGFDGDGPINVTDAGVAVKGYDVVAYFRQGKPAEGSREHTLEHRGATFRFANAENRARFARSREKYTPVYGGYCALGVASGYKDDMHPSAFAIADGRLYFNLSPRIHMFWNQARKHGADLIAQADANWPELRDQPGHGPRDAR